MDSKYRENFEILTIIFQTVFYYIHYFRAASGNCNIIIVIPVLNF